FALGTGVWGTTRFKGGSYYQVYGDRKYSEVVLGRWNEENRATATYPRLTTTENTNNFINSTFWKYDYNRFDLSKIQITYDLSDYFSKNSAIKRLSAYVSGENLLTVSKERKLMITSIGTAPQARFYNMGVKVSF
ncbi:MAG TPA: SusC/RagA family TonB-linked outer membrane protein, partial [Bacteroidales bacterium]|nr:SusC/RagA family TonB-linked outer membrane protein [Bacteroidales bacterium]